MAGDSKNVAQGMRDWRMSWEQRGDRRYYYRAWREGRRVVKFYFGIGADAEQAAQRDQEYRQERLASHERIEVAEKEVTDLAEYVDGYWEASEQETAIWLLANNFHRHRGEWRHRGRRTRAAKRKRPPSDD